MAVEPIAPPSKLCPSVTMQAAGPTMSHKDPYLAPQVAFPPPKPRTPMPDLGGFHGLFEKGFALRQLMTNSLAETDLAAYIQPNNHLQSVPIGLEPRVDPITPWARPVADDTPSESSLEESEHDAHEEPQEREEMRPVTPPPAPKQA
eukprot:gene3813-14346_t